MILLLLAMDAGVGGECPSALPLGCRCVESGAKNFALCDPGALTGATKPPQSDVAMKNNERLLQTTIELGTRLVERGKKSFKLAGIFRTRVWRLASSVALFVGICGGFAPHALLQAMLGLLYGRAMRDALKGIWRRLRTGLRLVKMLEVLVEFPALALVAQRGVHVFRFSADLGWWRLDVPPALLSIQIQLADRFVLVLRSGRRYQRG